MYEVYNCLTDETVKQYRTGASPVLRQAAHKQALAHADALNSKSPVVSPYKVRLAVKASV